MGIADDNDSFMAIQADALALFILKNEEYGGAYKSWGVLGRIARLGERAQRLRRLALTMLTGTENFQQVYDNLMDMQVETIIALMCLKDGNYIGRD